MKRFIPSPAMAVALVALMVALSGSAYAAGKISGKNIKSSSITGKQVKNSSLTGSDIKNGSIQQKDLSSSISTVGPKGDKGDAGANGTASAFAQVSPTGPSLVTQRTKGFSSVTRIATGIYCLHLSDTSIDPDAKPAVAAVEFGNTSGGAGSTVMVRGSNTSLPDACAAGEYVVRTFNSSDAAANTVAFTLVVP